MVLFVNSMENSKQDAFLTDNLFLIILFICLQSLKRVKMWHSVNRILNTYLVELIAEPRKCSESIEFLFLNSGVLLQCV